MRFKCVHSGKKVAIRKQFRTSVTNTERTHSTPLTLQQNSRSMISVKYFVKWFPFYGHIRLEMIQCMCICLCLCISIINNDLRNRFLVEWDSVSIWGCVSVSETLWSIRMLRLSHMNERAVFYSMINHTFAWNLQFWFVCFFSSSNDSFQISPAATFECHFYESWSSYLKCSMIPIQSKWQEAN